MDKLYVTIAEKLLDKSLDWGLAKETKGTFLESVFGDSSDEILAQLSQIEDKITKAEDAIINNDDFNTCNGYVGAINAQWDPLKYKIGSGSYSNFLSTLPTLPTNIFVGDGEVARTGISTGARSLVDFLLDTNINYIHNIYNQKVLDCEIVSAVTSFSNLVTPYIIKIIQACMVLEVLQKQNKNTAAEGNEKEIKNKLNQLLTEFMPPIVGNIYELTVCLNQTDHRILNGLYIFNSIANPNHSALTTSNNTVQLGSLPLAIDSKTQLNTVADKNWAFNVWQNPYPSQSGSYLFGGPAYPINWNYNVVRSGNPDSNDDESPSTELQWNTGSVYNFYGAGFTYAGANDVNQHSINTIQVIGIGNYPNPLNSTSKNYLIFRIGATYSHPYDSDARSFDITPFMDNFNNGQGFVRASYYKFGERQHWFIDPCL